MSAPLFALDPRLAADTATVTDLPLCTVLLMRDRRFPWLILVPRKAGVTEILDLVPAERAVLTEEVACAAAALRAVALPDKLNIGALGNIVRQLHIHIVARKAGDDAWPGPVWGKGTAVAYPAAELEALVNQLRARIPS